MINNNKLEKSFETPLFIELISDIIILFEILDSIILLENSKFRLNSGTYIGNYFQKGYCVPETLGGGW